MAKEKFLRDKPHINIGTIGDGGWGSALALILHHNGHAVRVWGPFAGYIEEIQRRRRNEKFLPGVDIILLTAGDHAGLTTRASVQINHHSPAIHILLLKKV